MQNRLEPSMKKRCKIDKFRWEITNHPLTKEPRRFSPRVPRLWPRNKKTLTNGSKALAKEQRRHSPRETRPWPRHKEHLHQGIKALAKEPRRPSPRDLRRPSSNDWFSIQNTIKNTIPLEWRGTWCPWNSSIYIWLKSNSELNSTFTVNDVWQSKF